MNIVLLTGSPRKNGNSNLLVAQFINGAEQSGHQIFTFDCAKHKIAACSDCGHCGMDGDCVHKDDFEVIRPHLVSADVIVFATPMYFFCIAAQLKLVIDRFYAIYGSIKHKPKRTVFMMTYAETDLQLAEPMIQHYKTLVNYMGWKDAGEVIAPGIWEAGSIRNTEFMEKAFQLGKNI
jgi:multimeric flavodoxin WrbA